MNETTNTNVTTNPQVTLIPITKLKPFQHHVFKPYSDKQLITLAASISEHGIIHPIAVRLYQIKTSKNSAVTGDYEIISGHNRVAAAKLADRKEVPAIVMNDLSDEEAVFLANEANIESRHFKNWLPSERIKSINQYQDAIKSQGIKKKSADSSFGDNTQRSKLDSYARQRTSVVYGQSTSIIRLYTELHRLIEPLQDKLDDDDFGTTPASSLSFIEPEGQIILNSVLDEHKGMYKITVKNSKKLRLYLEDEVDDIRLRDDVESVKEHIRQLLTDIDDAPAGEPDDTVKLPMQKEDYEKYFSSTTPPREAISHIIELLEASSQGANIV